MKGKTGVLIFNPKSGKGKAAERARDFRQTWKTETGSDLIMRPTRSLEDIRVAAKETKTVAQMQIFMGGDGTLSESLQGLFEDSNFSALTNPVGLLPGGTGNSFLRDFNVTTYEEGKEALLHALRENSVINSDVGLLRYNHPDTGKEMKRISFNIWGMGLISEITGLAIKMRFMGPLNYSVATLARMAVHRPESFRIVVDGKKEELAVNFITISNSRYTGGAMKIAPEVRINDGKLCMIAPMIKSKIQVLKLFGTIFDGSHINHPDVRSQLIQSFELDMDDPIVMNVDGELEMGSHPKLDIKPSFWKIYMPHERLSH